MNILSSIRDLFHHMQWADAQAWKGVVNTPDAASDQLMQSRLFHIHMVQHAFFHVWRGEKFDHGAAIKSYTDTMRIAEWGRQYHTGVTGFLATLDEASLDSPAVLPWASAIISQRGQEIAPTTLGETMLQVAMHSTYHRGQVGTRLRELGSEPPLTDYIAWLWLGRPQPEWTEIVNS